MNGRLPTTDARRATELGADLDRAGSAMVPGWGVGMAPGSFGRGLLEIAALLAEETSSRLDRTAERDALAFYDTLDIPPPAPQAATGTLVFVTEEARTTATSAPRGVQVGATVENQEVIFETTRALEVSPARIADVIAVDPDTDHIERAPDRVVATEPPPDPVGGREVVTAASAGSTVVQLAPAIGLEPGDQLRLHGTAYRIASVSQDLVTLVDPLAAAVPARTPIERIEALEAFTLRDLQQHAVYVGHASLLNLERPARIELVLTPSRLAARLAALDLRYSLWGTKDGEDGPAWHALELVGGSATALTVRKRWNGSVDEVEVEGRKSRWLRIEHPGPITTVGVVDHVDHVGLRVQSEPAAPGSTPIGSTTITNALHNTAPLAVSGRFLPFGPIPNRFDIFSLASPEAFSKKGARIDLDIQLADASLQNLVAPVDASPTSAGTVAYGIGANGLLHSVTISPGGDLRWQVFDNPVTADGDPVLFAGSGSVLVHRVKFLFRPFDVLVGRDLEGRLWAGAFPFGARSGSWHLVPPDEAGPAHDELRSPDGDDVRPAELALVPRSFGPLSLQLLLLRAGGGGLRAVELAMNGAATGPWRPVPAVGPGPDLTGAASIAAVQRPTTANADVVVTTDNTWNPTVAAANARRDVWLGRISAPAGNIQVRWTLVHAGGARVDVRPVAVRHERPSGPAKLWVAWVDGTGGVQGWRADADGTNGVVRDAGRADFDVARGSALGVASQPWAPGADQPLITAVEDIPDGGSAGSGGRSVLLWLDDGESADVPLPDGISLSSTDGLVVPREDELGPLAPRLVIPIVGEALLSTSLEQSLYYELLDGLRVTSSDASHFVELVPGRVVRLEAARIKHGNERVYEVEGGIGAAQTYRFLRHHAGLLEVDGHAKAGGLLELAAADQSTGTSNEVVIDHEVHQVTVVDTTTTPWTATLVPPLAGVSPGDVVNYTPVDEQASGSINAADVQTLVHLNRSVLAGRTIRFEDGDPRVLVTRDDALSTSGRYWRVKSAWTTAPSSGSASMLGTAFGGEWATSALERGYDNPELSWEFFDGEGWRRLEQGFVDGTRELATSGTVSFRVPATMSPTEVGGREDLWIRARLVGGDYGRPRYVVETRADPHDSTVTVQSTTIDTSDLHPPEITSIEASFVLDAETAPECVLVVDNLTPLNQTQASATDQARFPVFSGARAIDLDIGARALYVGLTRSSGDKPLVLFAVVDDQDVPGDLAVDVLTAAGWRRSTVDDETGGLRRTGLVQVFLQTPLARAALFGREGFWLRLRRATEAAEVEVGAWQPVVRGLFVNGVPAKQARTVVQEILGSSLGEPSLTVELAETPVLPDTLEIRVREQLSEDERKALEQERRRWIRLSGRPAAEAPPVVQAVAGVEGTWVLWRRVDSFIGVDGDARVYRLDSGSGRVTFGNGRQGKVPPAGTDAIRAFAYQQGGGRQGNAPAWSDLSAKSALGGIEAVVLPVDAAGGVESPDPVTLLDTAPARLRHAGRALTVADYEALAVAAAPEVVRARCASPDRPGDPIRVAIALRDGTRRPVPSLALRAAVARTLRAAGWGGLPARQLRVDPPTYVAVAVAVRLRVPAALAAEVEQTATAALVELLHPTDGGPDGRGWPFGRRLWKSDVLRALHDVDGIDRVDGVELTRRDGRPLDAMPADGLVWAAAGDVDVQVEPVVEP